MRARRLIVERNCLLEMRQAFADIAEVQMRYSGRNEIAYLRGYPKGFPIFIQVNRDGEGVAESPGSVQGCTDGIAGVGKLVWLSQLKGKLTRLRVGLRHQIRRVPLGLHKCVAELQGDLQFGLSISCPRDL